MSRADFYAGVEAYDRGDFEAALQEWLPLAEQGDPAAQSNVGVMYRNGQGVEQDAARAAEWFRKAADQGNPIAQDNLGALYHLGQGVPQSDEEATRWFRAAALAGDPNGQFHLAAQYANGWGAPQDLAAAHRWYSRAAQAGHEAAARARDELAERMSLEQGASEPPPVEAPPRAFVIQLGSLPTAEDARSEWARLRSKFPDLLDDLEPSVTAADLGARGAWFRVLAGPFSRERADDLCARLRERRQACLVKPAAPD